MVVMADIVCPVVRADVTCYWKDMWRRLDAMRRLWQLCDVRLRTDDGSSFMAHSPVLAASSDVLHHMLVAERHETFVDGPGIVPVRNVTPDVLRITLDFIYGVTPTSRADFERLRVGAARLGIEGAYEYCCRRLGENASRFQHMSTVIALPPGPEAGSTEATAVVESSCPAVSDDLTMQAEEASTGDQNSANQNPQSDAVASTPEIPESVDLVDAEVASSDVRHAAMMAHMSLEDLARSDECPHLRRLAGDILPAPMLEPECLAAESNGSLNDGEDFLDSLPSKKRTGNNDPSDSPGNNVLEELYMSEMADNENARRTDTAICAVHSSACNVSPVSNATAAMSLNLEVPDSYPQTILADNMTEANHRSTVIQSGTSSVSIVASIDFNSPVYATADFPALSYVSDNCYPMTCLNSNSSWSSEQHLGMAVTTPNLSSVTAPVPPFRATFEPVLSTSDVMQMDATMMSSVCPAIDVLHRSASMPNGCPRDMNFTDFSITANQWPITTAVSQPLVNGIPQNASMPADNSMMYFGHNSVVSTVPQYVPPVPTMNLLPSSSSSSSAAAASVEAAGAIAADLSYISLDDVSAVLKANGFSDPKTSLPSSGDVSPDSHTTESRTGENHTGEDHTSESHTSDANKAGTQTTVSETPSTVARLCIFCQKPCKSER